MKSEAYTPNVLKSMVLQSTERIYQHLGIRDMKVINVGGGGSSGNQDPAGQLLQ